MSTETEAARETRTMRLLSRALGKHGPLSMFLAKRRVPGAGWQTWEAVGFELAKLTGEHVTREGLYNMAARYGIPHTTRDGNRETYFEQLHLTDIRF